MGLALGKRWRNHTKQDIRIEAHHRYLDMICTQFSKTAISSPHFCPAPNVILILTDDMGYADISAYGASAIHTPNIDRLAKEGVLFQNFYSSSPV